VFALFLPGRKRGTTATPTTSACNLGVYFDLALSMRRHIDVISSRCYATLGELRAIRRYASPAVMQSLVTPLVLSRLDYYNSVLYRLPATAVHRLQAIQNAAARLIFNIRRPEHVTNALISLHWLRVPECIRFKMAVMAFRSINGLPPAYLHGFVRTSQTGRPGYRLPQTALSSHVLVCRRLATGYSQLPEPKS
jgi:hypothetical protein